MTAAPQLATRKPTGKVAFPLILVEGQEKVGKTYSALTLAASPRVGRTFVLELDEPTADEYATLGDFEILEHNGTFSSIIGQLHAAAAVPMEDNKPNVIVLDTGTALWNLLKKWAEQRARNSRAGQRKLQEDPDAEIDVSMNLWNDATDRWYEVINLLRSFPGIGVMVARSKETAKVVNGNPVAGQTEYKIEAQKSVANEVSATVRMERPHTARLVSVRSLHVDVPPRGLVLDAPNPLEHLVFDVLGAGGEFQVSSAVSGSVGTSVGQAKQQLIEIFKRSSLIENETKAKEEAAALWKKHGPKGVPEINDSQWKAITSHAADRLVAIAEAAADPDPQSQAAEEPAKRSEGGTKTETPAKDWTPGPGEEPFD